MRSRNLIFPLIWAIGSTFNYLAHFNWIIFQSWEYKLGVSLYLKIFQGLANHSMLDKNCSQYQFVGPATVSGIVGGEWGQWGKSVFYFSESVFPFFVIILTNDVWIEIHLSELLSALKRNSVVPSLAHLNPPLKDWVYIPLSITRSNRGLWFHHVA